MKLREHRLAHRAQGSITNQEIIRARAVTAELKLNIKKAYELTHMAEESPPCVECALKELSATMCSNP